MKLSRFEEQIFFSTVRITVPNASGQGSSIGTGFLYASPLDASSNKSVILLISNRHVYGDPSQPIILNFHKRNAEGNEPVLGEIVTLRQDDFRGMYVGHPDQKTDLACLNVSVIGNPDHQVFYRHLHPEMVSDFTEENLMPGGDVWFVGYPENRFDVAHNLPILRRGYIASIPTIDFGGQKQFLIDAQVYPGSSGSPVLGRIGNKYRLLGVLTRIMIRNEQLQAIPSNVGLGVQQSLGLGIVLKANLVMELVEEAKRRVIPRVKTDDEPAVSSDDMGETPPKKQ